jgi:hypothetical protein
MGRRLRWGNDVVALMLVTACAMLLVGTTPTPSDNVSRLLSHRTQRDTSGHGCPRGDIPTANCPLLGARVP